MIVEIDEKALESLIIKARIETIEDFSRLDGKDYVDIQFYCDGRSDEAYEYGVEDGKINSTREILELLGVNWKE